MNNIKSVFSIKDLENLSGIKAHTIRIWEKRYNVLEPMRTETNIRLYDSTNLQKLLSIALLHKYGYKISKLSRYSYDEIADLVRQIATEKNSKNQALSSFKMAMMNFDQDLFFKTYSDLLSEKAFREIFFDIFIPLLNEIGLLWQTDTITPAHEHFISNLIRQKIIVNTEKLLPQKNPTSDTTYVLFLPQNEIHELGLLYLNYELILNGCKTIFLGENIPIENLKDIQHLYKKLVYVTYMTIEPTSSDVNTYLDKMENEILKNSDSSLWIMGRIIENINKEKLNNQLKIFSSLNEIISEIKI